MATAIETTTAYYRHEKIGALTPGLYRELSNCFGLQLREAGAELFHQWNNAVIITYPANARPGSLIDSLRNDIRVMLDWHHDQQRRERERLAGQPVWQ